MFFSFLYLLILIIMSAPSSADVAAFSREALGRRQVATGLRPLVEALGIALPPREAESRGSRRGLRHYSKDEYIDALMAYRDALIQGQGGEGNIAAAAAQDSQRGNLETFNQLRGIDVTSAGLYKNELFPIMFSYCEPA